MNIRSSRELDSICSRFSAAAETYEQRAQAQAAVAEKLRCFLPHASEAPRILEIGCGTGLLTRHLLRDFPEAQIDAQDLSERMTEKHKQTLGTSANLRCHAGNLMALDLPGNYPLIASSSALHWILPLGATARRIFSLLKPGGLLVAAVMTKGTLAELLQARRHAASGKPPLADLPAREDLLNAFEDAGLRIEQQANEALKVSYSSASEFLRALHEQGLTAGPYSRSPGGLLNRRELKALTDYYCAAFPDEFGVYATFQVCYFAARRP